MAPRTELDVTLCYDKPSEINPLEASAIFPYFLIQAIRKAEELDE